ncbi:MAG: divergent polysaccharide deacetylase family protein [Thermodesulfobacteriota bacterium]
MKRREFLIKGASFLLGNLAGLHSLPRAFAAPEKPRLAIIIDDIGHSLPRARRFLDLSVPITFAVLPRLSHSHDLACEIHREGHEIMLHQPMEPCDRGLSPGPGALYVGDGGGKIVKVMEENISEVPFAIGVNNHMGSRFTASRREVQQALGVLREANLFFVDSLTSSQSVAYETARRLEVPAAFRHVFLDHDLRERAILQSLERLRLHAQRHGSGIGIGHPHPETARAIAVFIKKHGDAEVSLTHVSELIQTT